MAIYRSGKASIDAAGKITGNGTKWADPLNMITRESTIVFYDDGILRSASILDIESDTSMTSINGDGIAVAETDYFILVNDATSIGGLSKQVSEALRYFQGKESSLQEFIDWIENFDWVRFEKLSKDAVISAASAKADMEATGQLKNETASMRDQSVSASQSAEASASRAETGARESEASAVRSAGYASSANEDAERAKGYADSVNPDMYLAKDGNLSGLADVNAARANLGVPSTTDIEATYAKKGLNLSDLTDKSQARKNLQLDGVGGETFWRNWDDPEIKKYITFHACISPGYEMQVRIDRNCMEIRGIARYSPSAVITGSTIITVSPTDCTGKQRSAVSPFGGVSLAQSSVTGSFVPYLTFTQASAGQKINISITADGAGGGYLSWIIFNHKILFNSNDGG